MKRILLPAGGAILATGLLAAGLASSATAAVPDWAYDTMAKDIPDAVKVADFWVGVNHETNRLAQATAYNWETKGAGQLKASGGYTPDSKPGLVVPIGEEKKTAAKVKNINLPKTIGKVFFVNRENELKWCSATSIQGAHKNLVATAGHCVYDDTKNASVMDNWVFVPGYYQGKTPWGIYVGKTAYTHYDFSAFNDSDRDYAFVTVYNGIQVGGGKTTQVSKSEFDAYKGKKWVEKKDVDPKDAKAMAEWTEGRSKYGDTGPFQSKTSDPNVESVAKPKDVDTPAEALEYATPTGKGGVKLTSVEVTENSYKGAASGLDNNAKYEGPTKAAENVAISKEEYTKLQAEKASGKFLGTLEAKKDDKGAEISWSKSQFFIKKWVKSSTTELYWIETYFVGEEYIKDVGKLGDNVGGQGFAWNQKTGQKVFIFGYPAGPHEDGNKPYTGVTPKWCYGTTSGKTYASAKYKAEEHIAMKCAVTGGYDGSPWLVKYSNAKRLGYVNGVTSLFADQDTNKRYDYISSPYFDGETNSVYRAAEKNWSGSIVK